MSIPKGTPKKMKSWYSDHAQGNFLQNEGNNMCVDVEGTAMTTYRAKVILYPCEFPDSKWDADQKWSMDAAGFIVNKFSGMCVDGNVTMGTTVVQRSCQFEAVERFQQWHMTSEGFLQNKENGKCIDGKMLLGMCPFSDERWQIRPSGHVVNRVSGKCLDFLGDPGVDDGSPLVLFTCEDSSETDQRWELLDNGHLRNKISGKCAVEHLTATTASRPAMVLGACDVAASVFEHTSTGALRNVATGLCLNVEGSPGIEDNDVVDMWACQDKGLVVPGRWLIDARGFIIMVGLQEDAIWHSTDAGTRPMHNDMYKCVEVRGEDHVSDKGKHVEGAELWMDYCKVNTDQKWEITESGMIRNVLGGQKCLSVIHKTHTADPLVPALWIDNCVDAADPALYAEMKWHRTSVGQLKNLFSYKCMVWTNDTKPTTNGGWTAKERVVKQMECGDGVSFDTWDFASTGAVVSRENGQCLDVAGPKWVKNPGLAVQACMPGKESQQWEMTSAGLLRNRAKGMCAGHFIDPGNPNTVLMILKDCPRNLAQQWEVQQDGQIRNKASGLCLDVPESTELAKFYELSVGTCHPAIPTQRWKKVPAPMVSVE
jgi:hypothetical protein